LVSELKKERRKLGIRTMGSQIGLLLLIGIGLVVTLHQGINGQLSIGIVVSTIYLLNRFENVINEILVSAEGILPVFFELKYIPEFFELPEEKEKENKIDQFQNIELDGVEFQYPGQEKATLKDITLKINKGERIAIVGANGSGKTTLAKLLLGLYEPTKGTIKINSQPTSKIDIFSWRKITGAVFQDFYRYKMSVRENIIGTFSNNHQFIEKVIESAKKAGIHNRINKLPYKYDTPLGKGYESAQELSGGEWQKIAISRAYYQDSQFLILDEPAASLDPHAEYDLYDSFYHLSKFKTLILITHRLSSTKLAERIIHLENGRIIEEGTHDELMQRKGKYAELYNNQAKWYLERGH
jgi:ATP-binding cassette subfamily B protein